MREFLTPSDWSRIFERDSTSVDDDQGGVATDDRDDEDGRVE